LGKLAESAASARAGQIWKTVGELGESSLPIVLRAKIFLFSSACIARPDAPQNWSTESPRGRRTDCGDHEYLPICSCNVLIDAVVIGHVESSRT
jgi:hypothetical protein